MKFFQNTLLILGLFCILAFLPTLIIPYILRSSIEDKLNAKFDFSTVHLRYIGRLGIHLDDIKLTSTNAPFEGQDAFSADRVKVEIDYWPLFQKKIDTFLDLDGVRLNIIQIGNQNNLFTLQKDTEQSEATREKTSEKDSDSKNGFSFSLNEFSIQNSKITYKNLTDEKSPVVVDVTELNELIKRTGEIYNTHHFAFNMFSGLFVSDINIDSSQQDLLYSGKCSFTNIALEDIFRTFMPQKKSIVVGNGNIFLDFNGKGITKEVYSKAFNLDGRFLIKSGTLFVDTAIPVIVDQLGKMLATLSLQDVKIKLTPKDIEKAASSIKNVSLKNLKGKFSIRDGLFLLKEKVPMEQGMLDLDFKIGVFDSALSGETTFKGTEAFTKHLVATNKNFSFLLDQDDTFFIRVFFSGTVDNPKMSVDIASIIANIMLRTAKNAFNPFSWLFN